MIPLPFFFYYIVIVSVLVALVLMAVIKKSPQEEQIEINAKLSQFLVNKETEWVKALTNISLLTLTACLAGLFTPIANDLVLRTLMGVMALASLLNLFFGVYIHLSEYFHFSYQAGTQREHMLHRALYRLNCRLGSHWHLPPFIISLIQLIIAGHIIIALFFY